MTRPIRNNLAIYDEVAASWWSDDIRWVRTLKNLVPGRLAWFDRHFDWTDKSVLDLGCAGGFMAEALTGKGARVTGIDPAPQAIDAARRHAEHSGHTIRYDVGVGESLPYADEAFDAVVCVDVLEHVSDLFRVLAEIERVLKPGGVFLFDTINRNLFSKSRDDHHRRERSASPAEGNTRPGAVHQAGGTARLDDEGRTGAGAGDRDWSAGHQSARRPVVRPFAFQISNLHGHRLETGNRRCLRSLL